MSRRHRFDLRVYYEDTDASGIVYHASHLRFAERARTEFVRALGFGHRAAWEADGLAFAVRSLAIDYLLPARLDDVLIVETGLTELSGARLTFAQTILPEGGGPPRATLAVTVVCLGPGGRPTRLPAGLRAALADWAPPG